MFFWTFCFGIVFAFLWVWIREQSKPDETTFYINLMITNKKEAIQTVIDKKMKHNILFVKQILTKVATKAIKDAKFCEKIAESLVEMLPQKLEENEIKARVELEYINGPLLVVGITVQRYKYHKLLKENDKEWLTYYLNLFSFVENSIRKYAADQLEAIIGNELKETLWNEHKINVIIYTKHQSNQGKYFFEFLKELGLNKKQK